jgi:chromate transporter
MSAQIHTLLAMAAHFALLSLFAVGGGVKILIPQMHTEFVLQSHWLSEHAFTELLAVSQAAPGPNFLLVPLIGFRVASWAGAGVALLAFLVMPVTIAFVAGRLLHRHSNAWVANFRQAFKPITAGLWIASGLVVAATIDHALMPLAITIAVTLIALAIDISPIWWCIAAGLAGYLISA